MKLKSLVVAMGAATLSAGVFAADMAKEMTVVSWGGAYSNSQLKAYHEPYMANNAGFKIINDDHHPRVVADFPGVPKS